MVCKCVVNRHVPFNVLLSAWVLVSNIFRFVSLAAFRTAA